MSTGFEMEQPHTPIPEETIACEKKIERMFNHQHLIRRNQTQEPSSREPKSKDIVLESTITPPHVGRHSSADLTQPSALFGRTQEPHPSRRPSIRPSDTINPELSHQRAYRVPIFDEEEDPGHLQPHHNRHGFSSSLPGPRHATLDVCPQLAALEESRNHFYQRTAEYVAEVIDAQRVRPRPAPETARYVLKDEQVQKCVYQKVSQRRTGADVGSLYRPCQPPGEHPPRGTVSVVSKSVHATSPVSSTCMPEFSRIDIINHGSRVVRVPAADSFFPGQNEMQAAPVEQRRPPTYNLRNTSTEPRVTMRCSDKGSPRVADVPIAASFPSDGFGNRPGRRLRSKAGTLHRSKALANHIGDRAVADFHDVGTMSSPSKGRVLNSRMRSAERYADENDHSSRTAEHQQNYSTHGRIKPKAPKKEQKEQHTFLGLPLERNTITCSLKPRAKTKQIGQNSSQALMKTGHDPDRKVVDESDVIPEANWHSEPPPDWWRWECVELKGPAHAPPKTPFLSGRSPIGTLAPGPPADQQSSKR